MQGTVRCRRLSCSTRFLCCPARPPTGRDAGEVGSAVDHCLAPPASVMGAPLGPERLAASAEDRGHPDPEHILAGTPVCPKEDMRECGAGGGGRGRDCVQSLWAGPLLLTARNQLTCRAPRLPCCVQPTSASPRTPTDEHSSSCIRARPA